MAEGGDAEPGERERASGPRPPSARDLQVRRAARAARGGRGRVAGLSGLSCAFPDPVWARNWDSGAASPQGGTAHSAVGGHQWPFPLRPTGNLSSFRVAFCGVGRGAPRLVLQETCCGDSLTGGGKMRGHLKSSNRCAGLICVVDAVSVLMSCA